MRQFKFRFWNEKGEDLYFWDMSKGQSERDYDENHIIMQYTGLKDVNGVKIYEGDIITFFHGTDEDIGDYNPECFGVVSYVDGTFYINDKSQCPYLCSIIIEEIKGNVYQNPEMIGGGEV